MSAKKMHEPPSQSDTRPPTDADLESYARQQEEFLHAAPVGVIVTDAHDSGTVRLANAAAGAVLGILPEALLGQPLTVLGGSGGVEEMLVQALVTEKTIQGEIALGDPSTGQRYVSVSITYGLHKGSRALLWWLNDVTDIRRTETEWRRRERQLHAVIDAAQDAVFEFQLNTGEANMSPRFWQMLGFAPEEAADMQKTSAEGVYYHIRDDHQIGFASSLRVPAQDEPYEWTGAAKAKDGREVWLHFRGRATDVSTEPRIIGVITDVTAQKAVEENLRQAKNSAEEANKAKSAFLATMSHEIRTPMTAILGSLEYLLETPLVKEQARMVGIAKESGVALLDILNDILDLSKIEAGKLTLESAPTSPRTLIQGACDAAQIVARQKSIYLKHSFASPPPGLIITDPTRVRQILMNLVNNAVKFTDEGGVTVLSEIKDEGEGKGTLRISVTDTGIGLTEEQRNRLFKPFSQADDSTTRKFGGTGLGLSICQRLVERMGGEIGVDSKPGEGSTFWFWVRIQTTDQQPDERHEVKLNGLRVLLLDPDPDNSKQMVELLRESGADITAVAEPRMALQKINQNNYALLILEQALDDNIKGLDLIPAIRLMRPEMGLMLYTAEEGQTIGQAAEQGGIVYLPRTAAASQFLKAVQSFALGAPAIQARTAGRVKGRILVAEDTAAVRQILEVQLRGLGVEVDFVENGKLALEKMQRGRYSLVISDLHMPEVDGYGLIHEWRDRESRRGKNERLPIVALTADVLIGDQSKFLAEGFDDYMAKPVSRDSLRQLVTKWLNHGNTPAETAPPPEVVKAPAPAEEGETPVNHARLIEILGLDEVDIIRDAMGIFLETAEELFADLETAYQAGDVAAAKGPAHSLKGSARMAGAVILGEIAAEIDAAAKQGQLVPEKLEVARKELARVVAYVKQTYLKS